MRLSRNIDNDADLALLNEAAKSVVQHRNFILGPEVEMLEHEMAGWLQTKYAVGCNSGFGAQLLGILALDLELGARIAVPVLAPSDSIGVLLRKHFTPVLVDINTYDFQMDVSDLSHRIDDKISAIIVHHLFGGTADIKAIINVAGKIPVIEVLTYSLGARIDDHYAGISSTMATADLRLTIGEEAWGDAGMIWTSKALWPRRYVKFVLRRLISIQALLPGTSIKILFLLHFFYGNSKVGRRRQGSDRSRLLCLLKRCVIAKCMKLLFLNFTITIVLIWLFLPNIAIN
jgi:hypothetical protein